MSKGKLQKFAEMETFSNVFQFPYSAWKYKEDGKLTFLNFHSTPLLDIGTQNISTMITPSS